MTTLKIIVVLSAVLAIGRSATQCSSDQTVQFDCLSPTCVNTMQDEKSQGQLRIQPKSLVTIVGINENSFLIKNKGKLSITSKNSLSVKSLPTSQYWKFKVNIHKTTLEVCESNNQSNEENHFDSNIDQMIQTNDENTDLSKVNEDDENVSVEEESDFFESIEIESEEELNLNSNLPFKSLNINSNFAEQITPPISDQIPSLDHNNFVKNDLNEKNTPTTTSPQKLENDSLSECTLDSCEKDKYFDSKKLGVNIVTKESSNNISPDNMDNSYQQKINHFPNSELSNVDSLSEAPIDNISLQNSSTFNFQDSNNTEEKITSSQQFSNTENTESSIKEPTNNDDIDKLNQNNPHQSLNANLLQSQELPSTEKTDSLTINPVSTSAPPNLNIVNLEVENNINEELKLPNSQQQILNLPLNQQLPNTVNTESLIKETTNNKATQNLNNDNVQDYNNNSLDKLNQNTLHQPPNINLPANQELPSTERIDNLTQNQKSNIAPLDLNSVDQQDENNTTGDLNVSSPDQQQNINLPTSQVATNTKNTDHLAKESINNEGPLNSNTASLIENNNFNNHIKEFNKIKQPENPNSGSVPNMDNVNNQQHYDNTQLPSLETEKLDVHYKNSIEPILSSNPIDINLQNDKSISTNNEIYKQTDFSNNAEINSPKISDIQKESKPQNNNDNMTDIELATSSNNSVNENTLQSSSLHKLINTTDSVSSDNQTVANVEVDNTALLNNKLNEQCTSESECVNKNDDTSKYNYEKNQQQYTSENIELPNESVYATVKSNNNDKSKEFESKSFVASFGHPDSCSGIGCLNFKRNVEKTIKPLNPVIKQVETDASSNSINTDFEIENKNVINEITEQSNVEMNFLDYLQNWLSLPTLNTIDFFRNVFSEINDEHPDEINIQTVIGPNKYINHSELYFIVVAIVTLLFSLIYYKYQKGTYENHLLTLLAAKEQCLLIFEKELSILKEQGVGSTTSALAKNSELETLNEHLTSSEDIISSQALRIEKLEQEIDELTESGMEMHTLLTSALESSAKNKDKLKDFKKKLTDSEMMVSALTQKNFDKTAELEKKCDFLKTLQSTVDELKTKNINLVEENSKLSSQLEKTITKNTLKESKLLSEVNSLKFDLDKKTNALITIENEILQSKNALQEVLSKKFNPAEVNKFTSSIKLSAELESTKQMCGEYKHKFDECLKSNQQYLDHIDTIKNDVADLENKLLKSEKEKEELVNKLNILTKFFKEQENDYVRQINEKSMLYNNKEGESSDLHERIKSLNQEIKNYKLEINSLKKEITDQEDSFKIQISAADKKASDYWISFRQAERKLKEMELESAQLRNKLTMVDKKLENGAKSIDSSKDFEDELLDIPLPTLSPDFTLLDFEPPPPILTNERLPPLGALGQAPSPPVPLSRRHNRSLSPGSPPPSQRPSLFRPLPQRYNYMNRQNSLGHSVESLDK